MIAVTYTHVTPTGGVPELSHAQRDELGGAARVVPDDLALDVPHVKARDVEVDTGASGAGVPAQPLHQHLRLRYDLAAAVARLPVAGTAPHPWNVVMRQTPIGQLVPNQDTKSRVVHGGDSSRQVRIRQGQIHRGLDASGVNPKAGVQASDSVTETAWPR